MQFSNITFGRNKIIRKKLIRYILVGGSAALVEWGVFAFAVFILEWHYVLAAVLSFALATWVNYVLSLIYVFEGGRHSKHHEVMFVYLVSAVGFIINISVLTLLIEVAPVHVMAAKIIATGIAFLWNFTSRHLWIFAR